MPLEKNDPRLLVYHKHKSSALTRFLRFSYGGMTAFEPMPKLSQLVDGAKVNESSVDIPCLSQALTRASELLGLSNKDLEIDEEFKAEIDIPGGTQRVYLTQITTLDPPFENAKKVDADFVVLTEVRNIPPVELELLRLAYTNIMG